MARSDNSSNSTIIIQGIAAAYKDLLRRSHRFSVDVFVLELGEDKGGPGYLGGAVGSAVMCWRAAALGEQGEPSFSPAAEVAEQRVAGAGTGVELLVPGWPFDRVRMRIPAPA
jgi:hypothetical protein